MKKILLLFMVFISTCSFAQKLPDDGFDKVRIAGQDKTIQADLKAVTSDPEIETDRIYYWYGGNMIHSTQGGFSGRLLNGQYTEYFFNKNLKEQGTFKKGLKDGIWRDWSEDGTLIQFYTWKEGIKAGKFNVFDERGDLKQTGNYRNNLMDGEVANYTGNSVPAIVNYRNGVIVATRRSLLQKINIFKKK